MLIDRGERTLEVPKMKIKMEDDIHRIARAAKHGIRYGPVLEGASEKSPRISNSVKNVFLRVILISLSL